MKTILNLFIAVVLISTLLGAANLNQASTSGQVAAYVEPGLLATNTETLSVIVTAANSQAAAEAVEQLGGTVSSDLWLIDAVTAGLTGDQLDRLASHPGIRTIVDNKGVETASVTYDTLTYQAADNSDPDGDSDGTAITVSRPE